MLMNLLLLDMLRERRVKVEETVVQETVVRPPPQEEIYCKPGDICAAPAIPPK